MFDYVRCDAPLPDGRTTPPDEFQTKDFDHPYLDHYVITQAGRLVLGEKDLNYNGTLNFYGGRSYEGWREFNARFVDGQLVEIEQVEEE
jgi:hypothetical protein